MRSFALVGLLFLLIISLTSIMGCDNNGSDSSDDSVTPGPIDSGKDFNLDTAIELALLSLVAYEQRIQCIKDGKDAITVPVGFKLEEVIFEEVNEFLNDTCIDDKGMVPIAFIATKDDAIYLAFRGTADISDDVIDTDIVQDAYTFLTDGSTTCNMESPKAQTGFNEIYTDIEKPIFDKLQELIGTNQFNTVLITGHSLGAALAVLALPDLTVNVPLTEVIMYSFAGPGVGNSDFAGIYDCLISEGMNISWRVVNTNDAIPKLPPTTLDCEDFMYKHVMGQNDIMFGIALPPLPDLTCDDSVLTIKLDLAVYLTDNKDQVEINHSICTYYDTLCGKKGTQQERDTCMMNAVGCE